MVVAVEDYHVRPDGTPRYTLVSKLGPFTMRGTSDYVEFDRPRRAVNRILDSPFGGMFSMTLDAVPAGTRVTERWIVEPRNLTARLLLPLARPVLAWSLRRDLRAWARGAAARPG